MQQKKVLMLIGKSFFNFFIIKSTDTPFVQWNENATIIKSELHNQINHIHEGSDWYESVIKTLTKLTIFSLERIQYDTLQINHESFRKLQAPKTSGSRESAITWFACNLSAMGKKRELNDMILDLALFLAQDMSSLCVMQCLSGLNIQLIYKNNVKKIVANIDNFDNKKELLHATVHGLGNILDILKFESNIFKSFNDSHKNEINYSMTKQLKKIPEYKPISLYKTLIFDRHTVHRKRKFSEMNDIIKTSIAKRIRI